MKIIDFIKTTKENDSDFIPTKRYITSAEKVLLAKEVIDCSIRYDRGFINFDSYKKHLAFIFASIEAHTDLRFADDWNEKIQEYDALCEADLLGCIIGAFEKDHNATRGVLDMMCTDMLAENSLEASIAKLAQSVSENLDVFVGALADKLEDLDIEKIIPDGLDLNKLQEFLDKLK